MALFVLFVRIATMELEDVDRNSCPGTLDSDEIKCEYTCPLVCLHL